MVNNQLNISLLEASVKLYSIHRAATLLGIGRDALLSLVDRGEISTIDVLGRKKISLSELLRYSKSNSTPIPSMLTSKTDSTNDRIERRKIDQEAINKIFDNAKAEVLQNEKKKQNKK